MPILPAGLRTALDTVEGWVTAHAIALLRVALGVVFLLFGFLKLFPGVSPAQQVAVQTTELLTFGVVPAGAALLGVAVMECTIGLSLITGRFLGLGLGLLGVALVGILSPLVLLTGDLFTGPHGAPNLLGQYVIKDLILAAAALVMFASARGANLTPAAKPTRVRTTREKMDIVLGGLRGDRPIAAVCAEHAITQDEFFAWRDELLDGTARILVTCRDDADAGRLLSQRVTAARAR